MIHPNEQLHRDLLAEFQAGNADNAWKDGYSDGVVAHCRGRHRYSGDFGGKAGVIAALARTYADFPNQQLDLHDIVANERHLVYMWGFRWERDGRTLEGRLPCLYNLDEGGK